MLVLIWHYISTIASTLSIILFEFVIHFGFHFGFHIGFPLLFNNALHVARYCTSYCKEIIIWSKYLKYDIMHNVSHKWMQLFVVWRSSRLQFMRLARWIDADAESTLAEKEPSSQELMCFSVWYITDEANRHLAFDLYGRDESCDLKCSNSARISRF